MKRFFTIAAMICAVAMTACTDPNENPYDGAPEPVFTLSTTSVEVPQAGGNIEIPFTIENPGEWAQVRATTATKWIKDLAWDAEAKKITFTAAANNSDDPLTGGVITVAYNFKEYNISVSQLGIAYDYRWTVDSDVTSTALYDFDDETNVYNAVLEAAIVEGEGDNMAVVGVALFDIYYDYTKAANGYCYDLPAGIYNVDEANSYAANTLSSEYSYISTDVENEFEEEIALTRGSLTVTADGWVARLFDENGKSYRIECDATPHIDTPTETFYGITPIEGDWVIDFTAQPYYLMGVYYGDYYENDTHNYTLALVGVDGYTQYVFDIVADSLSTNANPTLLLPLGEFPFVAEAGSNNGALAGGIDEGYTVGCYGVALDMEAMKLRYMFMKSGKIKISTENPEDGADAKYKIEIEAYDDHHAPGYKISGTYEGWLHQITDKSVEATAAAPAKAAANTKVAPVEFMARR